MTRHIEELSIPDPIVISPDAGRAKMAERLANRLHAPFAMLIEAQSRPDAGKQLQLVGNVEG